MLTIWKYDVHPDEFTVEMPMGARVLSVAEQHGRAQMWALVCPDARRVVRRFVTVGTGHPLGEEFVNYAHVGTFQMDGGALVFHLFSVTP